MKIFTTGISAGYSGSVKSSGYYKTVVFPVKITIIQSV